MMDVWYLDTLAGLYCKMWIRYRENLRTEFDRSGQICYLCNSHVAWSVEMSEWSGGLFFWMICTHAYVYEGEQALGHARSVSVVYMLAVEARVWWRDWKEKEMQHCSTEVINSNSRKCSRTWVWVKGLGTFRYKLLYVSVCVWFALATTFCPCSCTQLCINTVAVNLKSGWFIWKTNTKNPCRVLPTVIHQSQCPLRLMLV